MVLHVLLDGFSITECRRNLRYFLKLLHTRSSTRQLTSEIWMWLKYVMPVFGEGTLSYVNNFRITIHSFSQQVYLTRDAAQRYLSSFVKVDACESARRHVCGFHLLSRREAISWLLLECATEDPRDLRSLQRFQRE